jgi:hypothetical protein
LEATVNLSGRCAQAFFSVDGFTLDFMGSSGTASMTIRANSSEDGGEYGVSVEPCGNHE